MKSTLHVIVAVIAFGSVASFAQQARVRPMPEQIPSISMRPTGSSLGTIRVGAADRNIWFDWRVGVPGTAIKSLTLSEMLPKIDVLAVASVEASSSQTVAPEIPKKLDYRLQPGERNAVVYRLKELGEQMLAYRVDTVGAEAATRRKVFEFAKAIGAPTLIVAAGGAALADLDKLAEEFGVNVAVESKGDPKMAMQSVEGRGKRIGVAADLGGWMQSGIKPVDGLAVVKERLM